MYHGKHLKKLGRKTSQHRMDMLQNMVTSLIKHGRIETTYVKAKSMQRLAEKMVTYFKKDSVHSENIAKSFLREHDITVPKLKQLAEDYKDREGGYTRVFKNGNRHGDNAPMGVIEYIDPSKDLKSYLLIKAEARLRNSNSNVENNELKTSSEIQQFLDTCMEKNNLLQKKVFLDLKNRQKQLKTFERSIEKLKKSNGFDTQHFESMVTKEMEKLKLTE